VYKILVHLEGAECKVVGLVVVVVNVVIVKFMTVFATRRDSAYS
jgi:hypothetical protein